MYTQSDFNNSNKRPPKAKYEVILWRDNVNLNLVNCFHTMDAVLMHLAAHKIGPYEFAAINIYEPDMRTIKEVVYLDKVNGSWERLSKA